MPDSQFIRATETWLNEIVIGLQLCPFAQQAKGSLRYQLSNATQKTDLLADFEAELNLLQTDSSIETTLLIHPFVLQDFHHYNQFLELADELLGVMDLVGEIQIASFHPSYQFAGSEESSAENYSNRSPYPMLHLLREASVSRAVDSYPDIHKIPQRNEQQLRQLGSSYLSSKLQALRE